MWYFNGNLNFESHVYTHFCLQNSRYLTLRMCLQLGNYSCDNYRMTELKTLRRSDYLRIRVDRDMTDKWDLYVKVKILETETHPCIKGEHRFGI